MHTVLYFGILYCAVVSAMALYHRSLSVLFSVVFLTPCSAVQLHLLLYSLSQRSGGMGGGRIYCCFYSLDNFPSCSFATWQ